MYDQCEKYFFYCYKNREKEESLNYLFHAY